MSKTIQKFFKKDFVSTASKSLNVALDHPGWRINMAKGETTAKISHSVAMDLAEQLGIYSRNVQRLDRPKGEIYFKNGSIVFYQETL